MKITELHYSVSNNYLIEGENGRLLFDTGWAGTLPLFLRALGELHIPVQSIDCILISHFHPDHAGIAQEIADLGPAIIVTDVQRDYIHAADAVFAKDEKLSFRPINEEKVRFVPLSESREFLSRLGLAGEILHTPGHSDDSISLLLDSGECFVGDLNPLYELELHRGSTIGESWKKLLARGLKKVYYGHAKTAVLDGEAEARTGGTKAEAPAGENKTGTASDNDAQAVSAASSAKKQEPALTNDKDRYRLVSKIVKCIDRHMDPEKIRKKTGADPVLIEDVTRMYLTHQNVGVQGILDRIEIKGK